MKLTDYIQEHYNGNVSAYARANNYHVTQVERCIAKDGEYNDGERPFFKKYLKEKSK